MQAAERFDPARGVAFTTFAYYRIRGAILDSLRRDPERGRLRRQRAVVDGSGG
jgi:RNA polymerase sigma factor for flagellar operon FliA